MTQQWIRGKKNTQPLHIRADPLISEVRKDIAQISKGSEDKLTRFANQFEKMLSRSNYEIEAYYYGDIFTKVVFPLVKSPLTLYALNKDGQAITDLVGNLERYIIIRLEGLFRFSVGRQRLIKRILARKSLGDLSDYLRDLEIWDKEDLKKVGQIVKVRNSSAHKKVHITSKGNSRMDIQLLGINISETDIVPLFIDAIVIIVKLVDRYYSVTDRGIIVQALLDSRISSESEVYKLLE